MLVEGPKVYLTHDSIELQSSKRVRVEVDLANLLVDPCLRKKFLIIILMIEIKFEEHICRNIPLKYSYNTLTSHPR
jgi:RNase P/RNase MRP subunit p30